MTIASLKSLPEEDAVRILKAARMSITPVRKKVLALFMVCGKAMQHNDIERLLEGFVDRISLYRTLQTFVKKKIIHTIPSDKNNIQYAFGHPPLTLINNSERHVHLFCECCEDTLCMDLHIDINLKEVQKAYSVRNVDVVLRGICEKCCALKNK